MKMNMATLSGLALVLAVSTTACGRDCPLPAPTTVAPQPSAASPSAAATGPAVPIDAGAPPNAVQHEMQLLQAAMQVTLSGIAIGDVRAVPAAIEEVHHAKQATEAALESGAYRLARNADHLAHFRELDEAFHGNLEHLVEAATRNDVPATAEAFGAAIRGCQTCHGEFRK